MSGLFRVLSMNWYVHRVTLHMIMERLKNKDLIPVHPPFRNADHLWRARVGENSLTSETHSEPSHTRWHLKEREWVPRRSPWRGTFRRRPVTGRARIPRGPVAGTPVSWRWRTGRGSGVRHCPNSWFNIRLPTEARSVTRASRKKVSRKSPTSRKICRECRFTLRLAS